MFVWGKFGYKIKNMGNSAQSFKQFYEVSFLKENPAKAQQLSNEFFKNFMASTPRKLKQLELCLKAGQFEDFYNLLPDLKYLIEYSNDLSRYWYFLRGYSGALAKLRADQTVKGSKKLYSHYFERYGDRRIIRNEHWFEKKRWEFLDELQSIFSEYELELFIRKYRNILSENFEVYSSFILIFIKDLKILQSTQSIEKN